MKYYRLCRGLNNKGKLIPVGDNIYDHIKDLSTDYYQSVYLYDDKHFEQFNKQITEINDNGEPYKTQQGCSGINDVLTNKIIFDFDIDKKKTKSISDCKQDALKLCSRLISKGVPKSALQITFSGNKGFGIVIETEEKFTPDEHKNMAKGLAGDLPTWDTKVYNASRVLRVTWSRHQTSKLYKIPLTLEDLSELNTPEIKDYAGSFDPKEHEVVIPETWAPIKEVPASILELKIPPKKVKNTDLSPLDGECELDLTHKPKWLSNWKYALLNGYYPEGCRSYALMILGATIKSQGIPKNVNYGMLKESSILQARILGNERFDKQDIWKTVIKQVYGNSWQGGTYSEDNFPDELKEYLEELGIPRESKGDMYDDEYFMNIDDVHNIFDNFAKNIDSNTIKTGIKPLDEMCRITSSMLVGLIGAPSSGKSSVMFEVLKNTAKENIPSMCFSLDMGSPLVYQRLAQKETGHQSDVLFDIYKNNDVERIQKIKYKVKESYEKVRFCFRTALTVPDIKNKIIQEQEKTGVKFKLIVIDYLECLQGKFSDPTANIAMISQELKDLANDLDVCVFLLLQPPKRVGDASAPIKSYRDIKGSSSTEQCCSVIIGLWREGFHPDHPEDDRFSSLAILKNRMGSLGSVDCSWDGLVGEIAELDDSEKLALKELRQMKAQERSDDLL